MLGDLGKLILLPKALKSCPKFKKLPDLVTLRRMRKAKYIFTFCVYVSETISFKNTFYTLSGSLQLQARFSLPEFTQSRWNKVPLAITQCLYKSFQS